MLAEDTQLTEISASQSYSTPPTLPEGEYQAALAVSPLFGRVHLSVLWVIAKIFAAALDKRVKRGGCLFLAHLLRFSSVDQLSLFPGTEVCDVAKISIPNVLKLCLDKKRNGWPWCYDTTLKYLNLLVAAGVLVVRLGEPGIYYLPLGTYALLPDHAGKQVEKLAGKRSKVSGSAAFKRTAIHCALPGTDLWRADSPKQDALVIDEQGMQHMVQVLCATVQRCQGVALLPTTIVEVTRVLAKHTPRVLKKGGGRFIKRAKEEALQLLQASRITGDEQSQEGGRNSHTRESTIAGLPAERSGSGRQENPLPDTARTYERGEESTSYASDLAVVGEMVDSPTSALSDKNITSKKVFLNTITLSENAPVQESIKLASSSRLVDSPVPDDVATEAAAPAYPISLSTLLFWRFPKEVQALKQGESIQSHLAMLLSIRFEGNTSRVRHYMTLLGQDPQVLDRAIVDSLVRSYFPDPRHEPDQLGGSWVTKMYKAYCAGAEVTEEILAWSNTMYTYDALKAVLEKTAQWQEALGQPRRRPRPQDVVVDSTQLGNFWVDDAARGLHGVGYVGVDLEGELLTCEEYEQRRRELLACMLFNGILALSPEEYAYEYATYLDWMMLRACDEEEGAWLLADLPEMFRYYLGQLERVLDPERYALHVQIAPLSRRRMIVVHARRNPRQGWLLRYGSDVDAFINWYQRSLESEGESTNCFAEDEAIGNATGGECRGTQVDLKVGSYTLTFDAMGATIEHEGTVRRYRLNGTTTTADVVRFHPRVIFAMTHDVAEDLEAYRIEERQTDGH